MPSNCGGCGGFTGAATAAVVAAPSFSLSPERNPLTGEPLSPGQTIVRGPSYTGPRETVVWRDNPGTWPHWITPVNGVPTDDGSIPGGTWAGLPEITVTGQRSLLFQFAVLALALLALGVVIRAVRK